MKYIFIVTMFFLLQSCGKKDCPDCFNYTEPLRISYLDNSDQNLLDPLSSDKIKIESVVSKFGSTVEMELKNTIGGVDIEFWFLESINRPNRTGCNDLLDCALCVNEECELYIYYEYSTDVDTLNVLYEQHKEFDDDGCFCTSYPMRYIKLNGREITEFNTEETGAAIIRK